MLVVKMATEFQGYVRDLHDEAVSFLAASATGGNQGLASVFQNGMSSDRALNENNAGIDTLSRDFVRIGLPLWRALNAQEPTLTPGWRADLRNLIDMGNAIAHEDRPKLLNLESGGLVLGRTLTARWHASFDSLVSSMDDVVADYLGALLGVPQPW